MMVVIALMAVMLALALPSFNNLIEKYRVEGVATALVASMSHARSEAVRRGQTLTVQQRTGCADGKDWSCGWDTIAGSGTGSAETLKQQDPDTRVTVTKSAAGSVSFDAMGNSAGIAAASFKVYPVGQGTTSSNAATVCMARSGRIQLAKGGAPC